MLIEVKEVIQGYEQAVAKVILFCVSSSPLSLGINKTISILRGSKSTFIIEHDLYTLPVYGVFSTFTAEYLHTVIEVLLEQELISIEMVSRYDNLPTLKITRKGQDYLAGQVTAYISFVDKLNDRDVIILNEEEQVLFDALRHLR